MSVLSVCLSVWAQLQKITWTVFQKSPKMSMEEIMKLTSVIGGEGKSL